jgi:ABC-2 type transport system ATP-binding protein
VHRPTVLFLDEPTIGLDVGMQLAVRAFVQRYNERHGATVILTSHYMDDVVALCPRVIVLDQGAVAYDGSLEALVRRVRPEKRVVLRLTRAVLPADLAALGMVVRHAPLEVVLDVDPARIQTTLTEALAALPIRDLTVEDPPLEEVMAEIFAGQRDARRKAPS